MKEITKIDWHRKVDEVIILLLNNLDKPLSYRHIAEDVSSSPDHFHKQFKRLTGETFKSCFSRLRLEKAMFLLRNSDKSITDIAFDSGYTTVEMLCKAVRKYWGMSPRDLRKKKDWHPYLPSKAGIHYSDKNINKNWFYVEGESEMDTKIVQFDDKKFYGYKLTGDYWQLPKQWERFWGTLNKYQLQHIGKEFMSVFPDSRDSIPQEKKNAYAGFVVDKELEDLLDFEELTIPSGLYAVTVHFGSSETIGPTWDKWFNEWLPNSGWEPDYTRPNYEWYQNRTDNQELLLTFLVTSVKRKDLKK